MRTLPLLAALAATSLAACGYTPMYAPADGASPARAQVTVGSVTASNPALQAGERRTAQEVTRELKQYFPSENPNLDVLTVTIVEDQSTLAVQRNATVARAEVTLAATLTLTSLKGDEKLKAYVASAAAYNVEENPFSTESGRRYARITAAKTLAEEISRRVVLFYRQDKDGAAN